MEVPHFPLFFHEVVSDERKTREALRRKQFPLGREAACPSARPMARDEARHGKALEGLLKRYFK